jgi:chemotaxis protein MotA
MDIATIVGLLAAFGLILASMDDPAAFVDTASLLIVVAGSTSVVLFRSSLGEFLGAIGVAGKTFKNKLDPPEKLIEQIVELATLARKDGMIALEGQEIANPFLAKAVAMLVDGADEAIIKSSLEREKSVTRARHAMGAKIFSAWGEIAPAMGMIGTLVGLVQMLGNMSDPKSIGPGHGSGAVDHHVRCYSGQCGDVANGDEAGKSGRSRRVKQRTDYRGNPVYSVRW